MSEDHSTKCCTRCAEQKLVSEFIRQKGTKDGRSPYCKTCYAAKRQEWRRGREDLLRERSKQCGRGYAEHFDKYGVPKLIRESKRCRTCKEEKTLENFYRNKYAPDGTTAECKRCCRARAERRRKEKPQIIKEENRNWAARNADRINARQRKKYEETYREKKLEQNREWVRKNPEWSKVKYHRRRLRLLEAGPSFSTEQWNALLQYYDQRCLACGLEGESTVDHVVPVFKGGSGSISNIQPLCGPCNSKKHTNENDYRDPFLHAEFMKALEGEGLLN